VKHCGSRKISKCWLPFSLLWLLNTPWDSKIFQVLTSFSLLSLLNTSRDSKIFQVLAALFHVPNPLPFSKCQTPSAVAGSLHHSYHRRIPLPLLSLTNPSSLMCYVGPRCRSGSHRRHHAFTDGPPPCQGAALGVGTIWVPAVGTS
jgi:hypothetical protein